MHSVQDATAMQQQQQHYQMMQYMGERERDPDEPVADVERTILDFFNSDLNLEISKDGSVAVRSFVRSLRAGVQPTLDPSTETI